VRDGEASTRWGEGKRTRKQEIFGADVNWEGEEIVELSRIQREEIDLQLYICELG